MGLGVGLCGRAEGVVVAVRDVSCDSWIVIHFPGELCLNSNDFALPPVVRHSFALPYWLFILGSAPETT